MIWPKEMPNDLIHRLTSPEFQPDEDSTDEPAIDTPADDVQEPSIVAGVGSSALGSIDIEPQAGTIRTTTARR